VTETVNLDRELDTLVGEWLTVADVASAIGVPASRVKQMIKDKKLVGLVRGKAGYEVPAAFILDDTVAKGLPGTLTVLRDAGFDDAESLRWLFTPDDTLPGTPIQAIREHRGKEINRRAQAMAI
jgi:hypothetical protein